MNFDLSPNFGDTSFNVTEPFDLTANEVRVIEVNLTAGSSAAESNIVITIDATTANADPDSETTNFTFTASAGGPVFDVSILNPPTEANRSDPGVIHLNASLRNIGNETAGNVWVNWTLPSNWNNVSGRLYQNFTTVAAGATVYNNITVNLTPDAATGTRTINVTAVSNTSVSDSATANIVVTETSTSTTTTTTTTTGGGGGSGSSGGGGGGGGLAPVPEKIEISQTVELVRGGSNQFRIDVENTFEDSVLEEVQLELDGFLAQYLDYEPRILNGIAYQQTKSFIVTVAAPAYQSYEEHTLNATITGLVVRTDNAAGTAVVSKTPFRMRDFISLIIHEVSNEDAKTSLEEAQNALEEMKKAGFPATRTEALLKEARQMLEQGRYKTASDMGKRIQKISEDAFAADKLIEETSAGIKAAEAQGLNMEESKRLLSLALAAFEREDFAAAVERARDAQLTQVLLSRGRFNITYFVSTHWLLSLFILIGLGAGGYFVQQRLILTLIARRIEDLEKEESTLQELLKETQHSYYKEKKISNTEYHKKMYEYEHRLSEVSKTLMQLRSKRTGIIKTVEGIRQLKGEDAKLLEQLKQIQDAYFNRRSITKKIYERKSDEYKLRRIELEKAIAVLETKLAKKERLEELKEKETPAKTQGLLEGMGQEGKAALQKTVSGIVDWKKRAVQRLEAQDPFVQRRKQTVLQLKKTFNLDAVKSKERVKAYDDIEALEQHDFHVKPAPERISGSEIIKHLREVHKHG